MTNLSGYLVFYLGAIGLCAISWLVLRRAMPLQARAVLERRLVAAQQQRLLEELSAALLTSQVYLAYQPKLNLRTDSVLGVEALVRWEHPTLGMISREMLIPLAEQHERIYELTLWVLRRAVADQRLLDTAGRKLSIHINVSAGLLSNNDFIREVCAIIDTGHGGIGFEITETALIRNAGLALANLKRLTDHGIAISIDDYGSGMSSLAYLKSLPAQELKIDKMFISGMTSSHRDPLIVRSTIDLAHALGMKVVAEGVESQAALALLRVMGCDYAQGFMISPALPLKTLITFLSEYKPILAQIVATVNQPSSFWQRTTRDLTSLAAE